MKLFKVNPDIDYVKQLNNYYIDSSFDDVKEYIKVEVDDENDEKMLYDLLLVTVFDSMDDLPNIIKSFNIPNIKITYIEVDRSSFIKCPVCSKVAAQVRIIMTRRADELAHTYAICTSCRKTTKITKLNV